MNPEKLITAAGIAIERCKCRQFGSYKLIVRGGTLVCVHKKDHKLGDVHVRSITRWQLDNGLESSTWAAIGQKLSKIYEGLKL